MNHWMRTRVIRLISVLFGLSLVLAACDADDLLAVLDGRVADQGPAAEAAADDTAPKAADDGATADERDGVEGNAERREFQCLKAGVRQARKARKADADDTADEAPADGDDAPAKASTGRNTKDGGEDGDGAEAAPQRTDDGPTSRRAPAPKERAPSGGTGGGSSGSLSAVEQDIFDRLNAVRRDAGLKALTLSAEVSRGARSWSCDMAASGNLRHADLRSAGVYGENIAWGQRSAAEVHEGWMNSSGHRANRMSSRWSEYGVGVCENGSGRLFFTERFR